MKTIDVIELYLEGKAEMVEGKRCPKCEDILMRINMKGDANINAIMCSSEECDYQLDLIKGGLTGE